MPDMGNSRRETRILCRINVLFRLNCENCFGTCHNLGLHGMFIGYEEEVSVGETVDLSFMVAGAASPLVEAVGRIVWVNAGPDRRPGYPDGFGIEFIEISNESRELVRGFIEQSAA